MTFSYNDTSLKKRKFTKFTGRKKKDAKRLFLVVFIASKQDK